MKFPCAYGVLVGGQAPFLSQDSFLAFFLLIAVGRLLLLGSARHGHFGRPAFPQDKQEQQQGHARHRQHPQPVAEEVVRQFDWQHGDRHQERAQPTGLGRDGSRDRG